MALKPDVREIYLKRLLSVTAERFYDFKEVYNYAFLLLASDEKLLEAFYTAEHAFLSQLENEGVLPSLDYVLFLMDGLAYSGKKILVVKTKRGRRKIRFHDLVFSLSDFKNEILRLVRIKADTIRIINPEVAF